VITAAHCIGSFVTILVFGKSNMEQYEEGSTSRFVKSVTKHSGYNPSTLENDIAIAELSGPLDFSEFIQPICITDKRAKNREKVSVMGWGETLGTEDGSSLQVAQVRVINRRRCNRMVTLLKECFVLDTDMGKLVLVLVTPEVLWYENEVAISS